MPLGGYIQAIENGSWGSVIELQAFGESLGCSTLCYLSHTKRWALYSEGGLLNGTCVALYLDASHFNPIYAKDSPEEMLKRLTDAAALDTPSEGRVLNSQNTSPPVNVKEVTTRIKGKASSVTLRALETAAGQRTIDSYFDRPQEVKRPGAVILRLKRYLSNKNVKASFLTGGDLLQYVTYGSNYQATLARTVFVEVQTPPLSFPKYAYLTGAQYGYDVQIFKAHPEKSLRDQAHDFAAARCRASKFPLAELTFRHLMVGTSRFKTRSKKIKVAEDRNVTLDTTQLEATFLNSVGGGVVLSDIDSPLDKIKTLWGITSERLLEHFGSNDLGTVHTGVVRESGYDQMINELGGGGLHCIPFVNSPWNGEIPTTREEMIREVTCDVSLYNKELIARGSKLATGLLMQALIKGDEVFAEFPRAVLPFSAHNAAHTAKFTEEEIPYLLWEPEVTHCIAEAFTFTGAHGKIRNTTIEGACTTHYPRATQRAWNKVPCSKLNQAFVTIAFPKTMDIPKTWCRGILINNSVHEHFEKWVKSFTNELGERLDITPLLLAVSIEGHYGSKGHKKKKKKDEATGEDEEEEERPFDILRKSAIELCGSLIYRESLKGSAHLHIYLVCLTPGGRSLTVSDWQGCFTEHHTQGRQDPAQYSKVAYV